MADVLIVVERGGRAPSVIDIVQGLQGTCHEQPVAGMINCSIPAQHVHTLRSSPGVSYVRQVHSYVCSEDRFAGAVEESEN